MKRPIENVSDQDNNTKTRQNGLRHIYFGSIKTGFVLILIVRPCFNRVFNEEKFVFSPNLVLFCTCTIHRSDPNPLKFIGTSKIVLSIANAN